MIDAELNLPTRILAFSIVYDLLRKQYTAQRQLARTQIRNDDPLHRAADAAASVVACGHTHLINAGRKRLAMVVNDSRAVDRKSTRLNSSHLVISYAVFCLKKKKI